MRNSFLLWYELLLSAIIDDERYHFVEELVVSVHAHAFHEHGQCGDVGVLWIIWSV